MEKNTAVTSDDDITVSEHNYSPPKVETRTSVLSVFLIINFIINDYRKLCENFIRISLGFSRWILQITHVLDICIYYLLTNLQIAIWSISSVSGFGMLLEFYAEMFSYIRR